MTVIDEYIKTIEKPKSVVLEHIRSVVKELVPDAVETIGYGMPVFRYKDKYLIGFAAFKNHMSIFPGSSPVASTKEKLNGHTLSKGTIQFTLDKPLSDEILKEIISECIKNIDKR